MPIALRPRPLPSVHSTQRGLHWGAVSGRRAVVQRYAPLWYGIVAQTQSPGPCLFEDSLPVPTEYASGGFALTTTPSYSHIEAQTQSRGLACSEASLLVPYRVRLGGLRPNHHTLDSHIVGANTELVQQWGRAGEG